jgi:6-phosphogluconate dehydrogenase
MDEKTDKHLVDKILAVAKQNGTGMWTSQSSMELQVPVPTIDVAVSMRDLSVFVTEREQASQLYSRPIPHLTMDHHLFTEQLKNAFFAAMIITYAQGMTLLQSASTQYDYHLDLEAVAKIWRGGCIIRAKLLDDICAAYRLNRQLPNLLLDPTLATKIMANQESLRKVVAEGSRLGIPTPALMVSLSYLDVMRSSWLPANLIQAQRDYFGSHTYERIDEKGSFHTEWSKSTA